MKSHDGKVIICKNIRSTLSSKNRKKPSRLFFLSTTAFLINADVKKNVNSIKNTVPSHLSRER